MRRFSPRFLLVGLVRRAWLVTAITVISCAGLAARGAASILAARDEHDSAPTTAPVRRAPAAPSDPSASTRRRAAGDQLIARNMFCSSCATLEDPASGNDLSLAEALLIETSVGEERRATVRVVASQVQGSWGVGETIPGLGQVERIAYKWIELVDGAGRRGRLSLLTSLDAAPPAAGRGPETAISESPPAAAPWASRLRKIDEQTYEVERGLIRDLVTGVAKADGVRPMPIIDHGEMKGFRLVGVAATSIPAGLGLRSGDALTAIDGEPIRNVQQLLDLYVKLDSMNSVELSGKRAGKPLVRTLRLR